MNRLRNICGVIFLTLMAASTVSDAFEPTPAMMYQNGSLSLEQAIVMVQSKYGAKVMRSDRVEEGGRVVYYIRLMSQDRSRVWTVRVDAMTGREF